MVLLFYWANKQLHQHFASTLTSKTWSRDSYAVNDVICVSMCVSNYLLCVSVLNRALSSPGSGALAGRRPAITGRHGGGRRARTLGTHGTLVEGDGHRTAATETRVKWKVSCRCAWESSQWSRKSSQWSCRVLKSLLFPVLQSASEILFCTIYLSTITTRAIKVHQNTLEQMKVQSSQRLKEIQATKKWARRNQSHIKTSSFFKALKEITLFSHISCQLIMSLGLNTVYTALIYKNV